MRVDVSSENTSKQDISSLQLFMKKKVFPRCVEVAMTEHHKLLWKDDCMQLLIYFNFLYSVYKLDNKKKFGVKKLNKPPHCSDVISFM